MTTTPPRSDAPTMSILVHTDSNETSSQSSSPNLAATPVSTCFSPDLRSVSGMSTLSSQSSYSNISAASKSQGTDNTARARRRGYVRPTGGQFSQSAKNRDSVMSLGSIAHLQYYFARTGLLDGKGGHLARKKENGEYDIIQRRDRTSDTMQSPIEEEGELLWEAVQEDGEDVMLPPNVSTYRHRTQYIPPPPDQQSLKRDLVEALENALHTLEACEKAMAAERDPTQGFYEIQGLEILDKTTLAIRAAKLYYTHHVNPKRLHQIKSDQQIRKELYAVLEILQKGVARKFAGGLQDMERLAILIWVSELGSMITQENKLEEAEHRDKQNWHWLHAHKWTLNPRGQEIDFIDWLAKEAGIAASETFGVIGGKSFMYALQDGRRLIRMHNAAVRQSKKPFGAIDTWHEDTTKPYRRAENVRYWVKASELRFEHKFSLDVLATVSAGTSGDDSSADDVWATFERVFLEWARVVWKELTEAWDNEEERKLHARARSLAMVSPMTTPTSSPGKLSPKKKRPSPLIEDGEEMSAAPAAPELPTGPADLQQSANLI